MELLPSLAITTFYAGLLGVMWLVLTWGVISVRRSERISLGAGDNKLLERRMRGQANFSESVPLVLVLMALLEYASASATVMHVLGLSLVIGRAVHAYAFWQARPVMWARMGGMLLTLIAMACAAIGAVLMGSGVI